METRSQPPPTPSADQAPPGTVVRAHASVRAVLSDPAFVVPPAPPASDPVGTLAWLRSHVSRFSNGVEHRRRRLMATATLAWIDPAAAHQAALARSAALVEAAGNAPFDVMARLSRAVPLQVLGAALGVAPHRLAPLARDVATVAAAYHPGTTPAQRRLADAATARLAGVFGLTAEAAHEEGEAVANLLGVLVQACDATAGLIGNTVLSALRLPADLTTRCPLPAIVTEVLRTDPPVRSIRRQATTRTGAGGEMLEPGTTVVLDLAAANRDPAAFPDPHRFAPGRRGPGHGRREPAAEHLTFGTGLRPCPGADLAVALACGVVEPLLAAGELVDPDVRYEPPANLRIPTRLEVRAR